MDRTKIEWTDLSANPLKYRDKRTSTVVWGCVKKSAGCANCYAETIAHHYDRGGPFTNATMEHLTPFLDEKELRHILTAKVIGGKPVAGSKCFLGDMTDVAGHWVSDDLLDLLFAVMALRSDVTFQVLTKRPDRLAAYFAEPNRKRLIAEKALPLSGMLARAAGSHHGRLTLDQFRDAFLQPGPFPNLWLGTSVEHQAAADERIPHLIATPAAIRFLSCEPLLSNVDLSKWLPDPEAEDPCDEYDPAGVGAGVEYDGIVQCADCGHPKTHHRAHGLGWAIIGGESGPGTRPMDIACMRSLVRQCQTARMPVFVKQLGSGPYDTTKAQQLPGVHETMPFETPEEKRKAGEALREYLDNIVMLKLRDRKGGDIKEFPADLRIREFPKVAA